MAEHADAPTLTVSDTSGTEDQPIALSISSTLVDALGAADPDESLSITITGIPTDATLSNTNGSTLTPSGGSITFTQAQLTAGVLNGLSITPTSADDPNFTLHVTATANDGGNTNSTSGTILVTVAEDADAPVLDASKTPVLNAENQGVGAPVGAVGTLVSSLVSLSGGVNNVTDDDNGAVTGIALTNVDTVHGTWFYSTNGGTNWVAVGAVSNTSALLLAADANTRLYFQPSFLTVGTDTNAITFHAWDQSSGLNGASGVNASINGGSTAFSTATDTANITINAVAAPAGVAGAPINLALADPSADHVGPVTVTIAGVPAVWSLSEGTNNGDGSWTVQTNDIAALSITSLDSYTGALVLNVAEGWTNADGSTGYAIVADNVEVFAKGAPIFAISGDDTLTGSSGADLFMFSQPIGNDTIFNFNFATDKIDLTGFAGIASFGDIAAHIADDGHGDAVIRLGAGETIMLHGVNAASLTAADFVFNQTPIVDNAGTMAVSDGAMLPLGGTIDNTGTIALNSTGDETDLQIIGDGVTLQGGGYLTLSDSHENIIFGTNSATTLTNVDNTIPGAGQIGIGDGNLTLVNETHGTIDANISGGTLTLDTGHTITNDGILEATNGGTLQIDDPVSGGGSAIIAGGTLIFDAQSNMNVTFDNGSGTPAYGELVLGHASDFSGQISGFTGTAPDTTHSDAIDLNDISFGSNITFAYDDNAGTDTGGTLTIFGSGDTVASITFANGEYTTASFTLSSDGSGGTLITDPPTSTTPIAAATTSSSDSAATLISGSNGNNTITGGDILIGGGPANQSLTGTGNNDSFVFTPGFGHDTITNFQPTTDVLQIDHSVFANVQALLAATQDDGHGNVVITADAHDSIMLQHVTVAQLQVHQSDFHII